MTKVEEVDLLIAEYEECEEHVPHYLYVARSKARTLDKQACKERLQHKAEQWAVCATIKEYGNDAYLINQIEICDCLCRTIMENDAIVEKLTEAYNETIPSRGTFQGDMGETYLQPCMHLEFNVDIDKGTKTFQMTTPDCGISKDEFRKRFLKMMLDIVRAMG